MKANIEDVAREAGVHRSTVSRALTGKGAVSVQNRERVLAAVKKLNYQPSPAPGPLKSERHRTWGLLSFWQFAPASLDHNYSKILGGLLDSAATMGHRLLLQNIESRFDESEESLRFCHDAQISGLAVLAPRCREPALDELARLPCPTVLVAHRPRNAALSFIDLDNVQAGRMVVEHLAQKGHRRIAFVGGEIDLNANARDRHKGFLDGMKRTDLPVDRRLVRNRNFTAGFAIQSFLAMMALPSARPTAIFCGNDNMAAAVDVAWASGMTIPGDLSVAGVDDNPVALTTTPTLTTVRFPFFEPRREGREMLRRLTEDPSAAPSTCSWSPASSSASPAEAPPRSKHNPVRRSPRSTRIAPLNTDTLNTDTLARSAPPGRAAARCRAW
ncbi:MAG: LacI family DNA-binding transcriptional regulator [Polyangiaceae bacterium]